MEWLIGFGAFVIGFLIGGIVAYLATKTVYIRRMVVLIRLHTEQMNGFTRAIQQAMSDMKASHVEPPRESTARLH